ncbi:MAG: oligosaccharide flippase family protein [Sedimentisphaerales bacterium]|nr:oligosaccharide flippase family protein [Sedimentisphaerales bacterium]
MNTPIMSGPHRRLRANAFWGVVAGGCYALGRFGVFVIPAKFLPAEQVGWFGLALAVVTPLAYLLHLELRLAWVTDTSPDASLRDYAAVRVLGNLLLLAILGVVWLVLQQSRPDPLWRLMMLVGLVRVVESWADLCLGQMQKQERMRQAAVSHILKSVLLLAWALILSLRGWDIFWLPVGWILIILVIWLVYDVRQAGGREALRPCWSVKTIARLVLSGWPLGVFMALTGLNDTIIRSVVNISFGPSVVAYITAMTLFVTALVVVQNGVNQALLPRLALYYQEDRHLFDQLLRKMMLSTVAIGGSFVLLVVVAGEYVLRWVYREEYVQPSAAFFWISIGGLLLLMAMVLGDALVACRRFAMRMISVGIGVCFTFILSQWLISKYDLIGAAWTLTASAGVSLLISGLGVYRARGMSGRMQTR